MKERSTDLGCQYWFRIKGTRLLGEISDCRAQGGNIEEESGETYSIKKEMLKKKKEKKRKKERKKKSRVMRLCQRRQERASNGQNYNKMSNIIN